MTKYKPYPLFFKPIYKSMLWGGTEIASHFNRAHTPTPCAESWEVSTHPGNCSIIENGPFKGHTLDEVVQVFGTTLLGEKVKDPTHFPLLFKVIDAQQDLSVQVHPNGTTVTKTGGESKHEMWYVLKKKDPAATLAAGFKPGTAPAALPQALADKTVGSLLNQVVVNQNEAIEIPGGLVHSIGAGHLIYEVQQSSDTTFRLYDWDRCDAHTGKPRELHIDQAMDAIDWDLSPTQPIAAPHDHHCKHVLIKTDHFTFGEITLTHHQALITKNSFMVLFCARGKSTLECLGNEYTLTAGSSVLIPAHTNVLLEAISKTTVLFTTL